MSLESQVLLDVLQSLLAKEDIKNVYSITNKKYALFQAELSPADMFIIANQQLKFAKELQKVKDLDLWYKRVEELLNTLDVHSAENLVGEYLSAALMELDLRLAKIFVQSGNAPIDLKLLFKIICLEKFEETENIPKENRKLNIANSFVLGKFKSVESASNDDVVESSLKIETKMIKGLFQDVINDECSKCWPIPDKLINSPIEVMWIDDNGRSWYPGTVVAFKNETGVIVVSYPNEDELYEHDLCQEEFRLPNHSSIFDASRLDQLTRELCACRIATGSNRLRAAMFLQILKTQLEEESIDAVSEVERTLKQIALCQVIHTQVHFLIQSSPTVPLFPPFQEDESEPKALVSSDVLETLNGDILTFQSVLQCNPAIAEMEAILLDFEVLKSMQTAVQGDFQGAIEIAYEVFNPSKKFNPLEAEVLILVGELYLANGQLQSAKQVLHSARRVSERAKAQVIRYRAYQGLVSVYGMINKDPSLTDADRAKRSENMKKIIENCSILEKQFNDSLQIVNL